MSYDYSVVYQAVDDNSNNFKLFMRKVPLHSALAYQAILMCETHTYKNVTLMKGDAPFEGDFDKALAAEVVEAHKVKSLLPADMSEADSAVFYNGFQHGIKTAFDSVLYAACNQSDATTSDMLNDIAMDILIESPTMLAQWKDLNATLNKMASARKQLSELRNSASEEQKLAINLILQELEP